LVLSLWTTASGTEKNTEAKVAVANGAVITKAQLDREMAAVKQRLMKERGPIPNEQLENLEKSVLESLIDRELISQEAQKEGYKVENAQVDQRMKELQGRFPSQTDFQAALGQMGLSEDDLRSQIKRELTLQQFIDKKFAPEAVVTDEKAKTYYETHPEAFMQPEQVRARHILIKVEPGASETEKAASLKKLADIQGRVKKGEDFAKLATEFSDGPSKTKGGDLGYFRRGQMVKPFENAAFALKPGEVSDIVETQFGYHLIKSVDKKPESKIAYEEVKARLKEYLKQEKIRELIRSYIQELKTKAKVERFL
jgi:peptidyl-prolyl cis-trans isomerase C